MIDQVKRLDVAVGVIVNQDGRILITRRAGSAHQGGLWEFPGGKVEQGESVTDALSRELKEELNIVVQKSRPLIQVRHDYPDLKVLLDVWTVTQFSGTAKPCEGQPMQWVESAQLSEFAFPEANQPIITAVLLPDQYAIISGTTVEEIISRLECLLNKGLKLFQLRCKSLPEQQMAVVLERTQRLCNQHQADLLLNSALMKTFDDATASLHLTSRDLTKLTARPIGVKLLAASCHNCDELLAAEQLGVDFAVLSPVQATTSHPGAAPLGWQRFTCMLEQVNMPVYALGGMKAEDLRAAQFSGGQGIAGISLFNL